MTASKLTMAARRHIMIANKQTIIVIRPVQKCCKKAQLPTSVKWGRSSQHAANDDSYANLEGTARTSCDQMRESDTHEDTHLAFIADDYARFFTIKNLGDLDCSIQWWFGSTPPHKQVHLVYALNGGHRRYPVLPFSSHFGRSGLQMVQLTLTDLAGIFSPNDTTFLK